LAACAFLTGDYARASAAAAAMEKQQPHSQPHSIEALYWSIQANEKLAFESLARFQQLEPDSHRSHILLGDIYHQLERYKQAESEYQQALAIKPGDSAALLGLASSYLSDNNLDAAGQTARKGLEQAPEDPDLNLVMAEVELGQTQYAAALPYLEKGLHAKAQMQPRVHALMGKAYAELDRTQEAIAELKLGAASDEDGSIQYLLARLYRKSGDARDASVALETLKTIREKRRKRGYKLVEDPELSSSDTALGQAP
jgi:predicted Zn-dependent protease